MPYIWFCGVQVYVLSYPACPRNVIRSLSMCPASQHQRETLCIVEGKSIDPTDVETANLAWNLVKKAGANVLEDGLAKDTKSLPFGVILT